MELGMGVFVRCTVCRNHVHLANLAGGQARAGLVQYREKGSKEVMRMPSRFARDSEGLTWK